MFESFPKVREPLPEDYQRIYTDHYKKNREGNSVASGLANFFEQWMHRKVAADAPVVKGRACPTLEVGAGTLNHITWEPHASPYDIVEPFKKLYERSPDLSRVNEIFSDISEIHRTRCYQRIISIATFEHICNLPEVVAKCGLLLSESGTLRVAIPSEGTLVWKLAWKISTGLEFRLRYGLDYGVLMRYEHVNTAEEIAGILSYFFNGVRRNYFGMGPKLSLYHFYECRQSKKDRCAKYLERMGRAR